MHKKTDLQTNILSLRAVAAAVPSSDEAFVMGMNNGRKACHDDQRAGKLLHTATDVWRLLEEELSPQAIQRDILSCRKLQTTAPTLPGRIGFVVGYLLTTFTEIPEGPAGGTGEGIIPFRGHSPEQE